MAWDFQGSRSLLRIFYPVKKSPYIYPTGSGSINITAVVRSMKPRAAGENKHLNGFSEEKKHLNGYSMYRIVSACDLAGEPGKIAGEPDGVAPARRRGMAELVGGEDACSNRFSCSRSAL
jgi:hypothetical protein